MFVKSWKETAYEVKLPRPLVSLRIVYDMHSEAEQAQVGGDGDQCQEERDSDSLRV